ncbi:MAG TPA: tetratricopeptide repeat protein [Methanospirillum sp.]|nr:tetratricopeptide repeat protein [Methanospirillum sp.]
MDSATRLELKALLRRGEDALLRRDYERASTYFRRAYTADPGNVVAITNLGFSYAKMGRFSHAQKCFVTALDLDPDNEVARRNLGLLMAPDRPNRKPTQSTPSRSGEELFIRYLEWGNLQLEQKNYFAAIQYFREASRIHPDFIEPYIRIGMSFEALGEYAAATGAFSDALDIYPKDPTAQEHLNRCRGVSEREQNNGYETPGSASVHIEEKKVHDTQGNRVLTSSEVSPPKFSTSRSTRERVPGITPHREPPSFGVSERDQDENTAHESVSKPGSSQSDDDIISTILNQYSNLMGSKSGSPLVSGEDEEPSEIGPITPPSQKPPSGSLSSDDIVNSILMQYQEDQEKQPKGQDPMPQKNEDTEKAPYTGEAPLDGQGSGKTKLGIRVDLTDNQKDALRELGNIGASHAATTLSTMLNTPIMLNVPEISIIDFDHINQEIDQTSSAMVIFSMEGQMSKAGYVILHVPKSSVVLMTSIMLGMPVEPDRDLNEMDESAINEIGNIMVSAFLDGTAELLGLIMLPSPPRTIFDIPKNVFDLIIQESNISYDNVVFFKTELICDEHELSLNIFMLPNPPVLNEIVRMLEQIIEDSAQGR